MPSTYDSEKRTCLEICKRYKVKKPAEGGRYASGQARCQTCDIWLDHNGCILKNDQPATKNSMGWKCKCCNYRVRQKPRNIKYKEQLREQLSEKNQ